MPAQSWRTRVAPRLLFYALIVLAYLFICRVLVVHYGQAGQGASPLRLVLEGAERFGMDALAVSAVTAIALILSRYSPRAGMILLFACASYLMIAGAINVRVMDIYHQPATVNLLSYGNFLDVEGVRSLAKYTTRIDRIMLLAALLCLASFGAARLVERFATRPQAREAIVLLSLVGLVGMPLYGLLREHRHSRESDSNAGWWLLKSAIAPPSGVAGQIAHPDLRDPFESYAIARDSRITTPERVRQAHIRNVLVIVLESVGSEYLDLRSDRRLAPNLDRLKSGAAYFPNTYAAMPSSTMSLFSLMTGMYPPVSPRAIPMAEPGFPAPTLIDRLRLAGKRTGVFSANWGFMDFARYFRGRADHLEQVPDERNCGALAATGGAGALAEQAVPAGAEQCTFESLERWIGQSNNDFAALLWTYGTHYPYGADPSELTGNAPLAKRLYLARITQTDRLIGQLLAQLDRQNRLDNTLVVLVGDHGESFEQHGNRVHGNDIYQEAVRVPLILFNRRLFPGGVTDTSTVRMIDVAPTVLSLAGQAAPASMEGLDLSGPLRPKRVFFAAAWLNLMMGYREAAMKYDYAYVTDELQAFDLTHDPHERADLAPRLNSPERTAIVHRLMNWKSTVDMKVAQVRAGAGAR